jgi:hypothetical protein
VQLCAIPDPHKLDCALHTPAPHQLTGSTSQSRRAISKEHHLFLEDEPPFLVRAVLQRPALPQPFRLAIGPVSQ